MKKKRFCVVCGKQIERPRFRTPLHRSTCGIICRNRLIAKTRTNWNLSGANNPAWKGGIKKDQGYVYVMKKNHPKRNKAGYVKRANLIMEKMIGRMLKKDEMVHHRDGNRANDNPENLRLMKRRPHQGLEVAISTAKGCFRGCHKNQKRNRKGQFVK